MARQGTDQISVVVMLTFGVSAVAAFTTTVGALLYSAPQGRWLALVLLAVLLIGNAGAWTLSMNRAGSFGFASWLTAATFVNLGLGAFVFMPSILPTATSADAAMRQAVAYYFVILQVAPCAVNTTMLAIVYFQRFTSAPSIRPTRHGR